VQDPEIEQRRLRLERELGSPVTVDRLTRDFVLFQRRRGHRHSTDDLLTAWYATAHVRADAEARLLDLGAGIGSVGLSVLWFARSGGHVARLTAIEAQEMSYRLLQENVDASGVADAVTTLHGDLRDPSLVAGQLFDVVTGSPPYFDVQKGIVSADSQRAHARFELRGDIRDYARAAARVLDERGVFVFCFPSNDKARAEAACDDAGLSPLSVCDVVPRAGRPPLFSLFAYARAPAGERRCETFVVRDADGEHTEELTRARRTFGLIG
jgi:tRNA1Val (adenine37-N6)-methyltransferase